MPRLAGGWGDASDTQVLGLFLASFRGVPMRGLMTINLVHELAQRGRHRRHHDRKAAEVLPVSRVFPRLLQSVSQSNKSLKPGKQLNFASSQEELQGLMGKVSDWVQALFRDFPNTASAEQVHLEMLNVRGNVVRATNRKYRYLFLARHGEGTIGIEEYRTDSQDALNSTGE